MDGNSSLPGSPKSPLQTMTPERMNQRDSIFAQLRNESRESSVTDKISQFNSMSLQMQSKQLERKTADAALKRAMLGREEAEAEMRRYKDEVRAMHKALDEGKDRERRVGERLEALLENYGRAKETHAHTQALWEKEIRRARKETFKTQSSIVKLQEELKSARGTIKMTDENLQREKERCKAREQEAFTARYQIVGVQEQLEQALERIKVVEQERDAFKTAAKNEEVARIAAEGRIPLPTADDADDEFASPKKMKNGFKEPRVSLSTMDIVSSAASEAEIEDLTMQLQWEHQRATRAQDMVEFLQTECQLRCCPCCKTKHRSTLGSSRQKRRSSIGLEGPVEKSIKLDEMEQEKQEETVPQIEEPQPELETAPEPMSVPKLEVEPATEPEVEPEVEPEAGHEVEPEFEPPAPKSKKEPRRSTIFCPREGIFRTVSEQEAAIIEAQAKVETEEQENTQGETPEAHHEIEAEPKIEIKMSAEPPTPVELDRNHRMFARTPSVEPPSFALLGQQRTSLLSLLNAPHSEAYTAPMPSIPTMSQADIEPVLLSPETRPHTTAAFYTLTTTTTVKVHDDHVPLTSSMSERLRTPKGNSHASFDTSNPALTPTMTREEALAKIRERRGRARSVAQGTATPRRKMVEGLDRRDMSAPTGKVAGKGR